MSILNVNTIQPVGSGQTITVSATDLKIGSTILKSSGGGTFIGDLTGNINSSGVSTFTTIRGSSNIITIPTGHKMVGVDTGSVYAPGCVIQVVSVTDRNISSYTGDNVDNQANYRLDRSGFDLTTLDISIRPTSTSSKILILTSIILGIDSAAYGVMRLKRGIDGATPTFSSSDTWMSAVNSVPGTNAQMGSYITTQNWSDWAPTPIHFQFMHSPATTSNVTYRFNIMMECDASTTIYLNRALYNNNDYGATTGVSCVTLMEVAG